MKTKSIIILFFVAACIAGYLYIKQDFKKTGSTIYKNARIITLDDSLPTAQAMWVKNGIIKMIGTNKALKKFETPNVKTKDMKGAIILPGFIDIHTHVALSTFLLDMIDLSGFKHHTAKEVWEDLRKNIRKKKAGEWVICKGLDPVLVKDLKLPTMDFLNKISPDNPLVILSQSLHSYWANTAAFEKVGINSKTPDPSESSYYDKDKKGKLTGLIVEQKAFQPFIKAYKKEVLTNKNLVNATVRVMKQYAANGNTSVASLGITINDAKPLRLYEHLSSNKTSFLNQFLAVLGILPKRQPLPRHFIYIRYDKAFLLPKKKPDNDFYSIVGIKHWMDGSPYAGSMFLKKPYLDTDLTRNFFRIHKGHRGHALINFDTLKTFIKKYQKLGWQIAIHAQGDAAIAEIIKAYEEVNKEVDVTKQRNRIEHCLLLSDSDINKMEELNLTPSFHINHLYYYGRSLSKSIIGSERAQKILPVGTVDRKGMKFSLHADQPMFESRPFRLIQTAVERKTREGDTLGYNQRISVSDGLKAMTRYAAWQLHKENKLGSLTQGKYADFIVVDKNPLRIPTSELQNIKILQTFVNGNKVNY